MAGPSVAGLSTSDGDNAETDPPQQSREYENNEGSKTNRRDGKTTEMTSAAIIEHSHEVGTAEIVTDATKTNHAHDAETAVEVKGTMLADHAHDHKTAVSVAKTDRMNNAATATLMANGAAVVDRATDGDKTQDDHETTDGTLQPN